MTRTTSDGKKILITLDNVRVIRNDDLNVAVERLEETIDKKTKKVRHTWKFKGYYGTVVNALSAISSKEWLIDENAVTDLESYLKQVNKTDAMILKAIEQAQEENEELAVAYSNAQKEIARLKGERL